MTGDSPAQVVVAAGGLGTRVQKWAQFIPKEFYPVDGRPGIIHLLEEIAALGPARVVVVYHPYYEQFAAWARLVLGQHDHARYAHAVGQGVTAAVSPSLAVTFIPQRGPYADLTSVINGSDYLASQHDLYVAFADNLYPGPSPLPLLRDTAQAHVAVLASPYRPHLASHRGIMISSPCPGPGHLRTRTVSALIEKPGLPQTAELEERYGPGNLLMLEGRAKLTHGFIEFARSHIRAAPGPGTEPKLAHAISAYAHDHTVIAVPTNSTIIDLGVPAAFDTHQGARRL